MTDSTIDSPDTINDIDHDFIPTIRDVIDLSAIDANTAVPGDQAFAIVTELTGAPGELLIDLDGTHGIYADVDGGGADFHIILLSGNDYDIVL